VGLPLRAAPDEPLLRYVDLTTGRVHHFAGTGTCGAGPDGGPATATDITRVNHLSVSDTGVVHFTNQRAWLPFAYRYVDTGGVIHTLLQAGDTSGTFTIASHTNFSDGEYVVPIPGSPDVYVITTVNNVPAWPLSTQARRVVLRVAPTGAFTLVAGSGLDATGEGIAATSAELTLGPIAVLDDGSVWVAETSTERVRRIAGGTVTTIAGTSGMSTFSGDGVPASTALFTAPRSIARWRGTHVLIVDSNVVRAIW